MMMLRDRFGRIHSNLRVSVTDRCNIRCFYCMPDTNIRFKPRHEILTFEEIERFVRVMTICGVNKVRITGGEPLVRADLSKLIRQLGKLDGLRDLSLTTNGILLAEQAKDLKSAGLQRLNISLDTLDPTRFREIARRDGLPQVLQGIAAAQAAGFQNIRLNAIAIQGLSESEIIPLTEFAREHDLELRFIEFMPLDADQDWQQDRVLTGQAILNILKQHFGSLVPKTRLDPSQPAFDYRFADGRGGIGLINSVSQPFCGSCNRLRLTAEGQVRNCLFSTAEWDVRSLLRQGGTDEEIVDLVNACVQAKRAGHGTDSFEFERPDRAMYQIGG